MGTHANLFHVGDQDFEAKVLNSDKPVIVIFGPHGVVLVAPSLRCLSV